MGREEIFKIIEQEQKKSLELMLKKNADYGFSFFAFGLKGLFCQIVSKFNRLKSLVWFSNDAQVKDESILDTYRDLANYAMLSLAMTIYCKKHKLSKEFLLEGNEFVSSKKKVKKR